MSIITRTEVRTFVPKLDNDTYNTLIDTLIPIMEESITDYCNNHFTLFEDGVRDDYTYFWSTNLTFDNTASTITDEDADINFSTDKKLAVGDNIYVNGTRKNDGHYDIKTITDAVITVGDLYEITDEEVDEEYTASIFLVKYPKQIKLIVAQMIAYDILYRYKTNNNVSSEKFGDYSVSFNSPNVNIGNQSYPKEIVDGLKLYRNMGTK